MLKISRSYAPSTRLELISHLIQELEYKAYLEIGVGVFDTFKHIECTHKVCVDPANIEATYHMTSDQFFAINTQKFDLIFIDGLHQSDQVDKDILNSLKFINDGGTIVVHDCNPFLEEHQTYFPTTVAWTGDVWKSFVKFHHSWNLPSYVVDIDWGCGVIECDIPASQIHNFNRSISWNEFVAEKNELLGLIHPNEFLEKVKSRRKG